ncbi:MAG: GlsB/YeaQ/YmgE family stress response membrane protein [Coleofasciculus sp.]
MISTLLLGIVGAFLGGTLATLLTTGELAMTATSLSIPGVVVAILGAIIAIFIWQRFVQRGVY